MFYFGTCFFNLILEKVAGSRGGSTAVTAILINGETLIVANVGDSRAVLCRDGVANQLTVDHDPQKEKDLVESRGGCVVKLPGNVPRVDAQLAMSHGRIRTESISIETVSWIDSLAKLLNSSHILQFV
ncbi:putative protein-serine/threonine phosphatase [Rosa chinensis]|uniref:PPM-type phosphatase domain-containing protein n=1 Tax=Rosa chinensis TaxID=74649 RepID=A0A2P6Q6I4_ROSCH|nr:putative protein-serine/threonine phosphatase [Rosa chinensis]